MRIRPEIRVWGEQQAGDSRDVPGVVDPAMMRAFERQIQDS